MLFRDDGGADAYGAAVDAPSAPPPDGAGPYVAAAGGRAHVVLLCSDGQVPEGRGKESLGRVRSWCAGEGVFGVL